MGPGILELLIVSLPKFMLLKLQMQMQHQNLLLKQLDQHVLSIP